MGQQINTSMQQLVDHLVGEVPGVTGALVSSADGFVLCSRLPEAIDPSAVAAMSAASIGLASRLVRLTGEAPAALNHQRSDDGQVFVFSIAHVAVLTMLTMATADESQIMRVGQEVVVGLQRLFRSAAGT